MVDGRALPPLMTTPSLYNAHVVRCPREIFESSFPLPCFAPSTPFRRTRFHTSPTPPPPVILHQVVASSARNLFTKISWRRMTAAERSASEGRLGDEAAALAGMPGGGGGGGGEGGAPTTDATRWP